MAKRGGGGVGDALLLYTVGTLLVCMVTAPLLIPTYLPTLDLQQFRAQCGLITNSFNKAMESCNPTKWNLLKKRKNL